MTTQIQLNRSVWLGILMIAMSLLAMGSIALASLPGSAQAMLVTGVLAGIGWAFWKGRRPLPGLRLKPDGQIQISLAGEDWHNTEIVSGSFVSPGLSVVRLRTADGQLHRLTLMPDSAAPDDLRRLRVSLRWASRTRSGTASPGAG